MQDLVDRSFVITGANSGIGFITARELARRGAAVTLACRSRTKTEEVIAQIKADTATTRLDFIELDLSDLASVRRCADALAKRDAPIHCLVNNAGLAGARGVTKDGFELAFGTNHLGHYLLTRLLLDKLVATKARVVNVSSNSHFNAKRIDWAALQRPTRTITAMREYEVSKLANVLFTKELAKRYDATGIHAYALHPGVVATDVWRRIPKPLAWVVKRFMITPEQGAVASMRCATDPAFAEQSGRYYDTGGVERRPNRLADDVSLQAELWSKSAEWVGLPV
jgi:NAD(P)-dependent dehydrogenase (short-subunit alcohol dehydrogenase family)